MRIYIGADHGGFQLKQEVIAYLVQRGYDVCDEGDETLNQADDFQVYARKVAVALQGARQTDRGILICTGGQGMAMAANRFKGIRACVVWDEHEASECRHDNDSNVLALPARVVGGKKFLWQSIIDTWLSTPFSGLTRYKRRNAALDEL